jgi:hypothetical protein
LGVINLKVSDKPGVVVGAHHALPGDGLMLITQEGMIIRINVDGVRVVGRSTQGVKLMDLGAEDRLVAVAKLAERVEPAEGDGGGEHRALNPEIEGIEPEDVQEGPDLAVELADDLGELGEDAEGEGPAADRRERDIGADDEPIN